MRGALLASPVFAGSIALLLLNDHVLKAAWPGFVTGKVSDVAGVAMVAIGLAALLRRPGIAFGVTAVAFTLLKTVPVAAVWASPVLGGVTRTDPTDLIALLVLVPLRPWASRAGSDTTRDVGRGAWVLPIQIAAVSCAVVATTATSCEDQGVDAMWVTSDGLVVAGGFVSADGGATWEERRVDADRSQVAGACLEIWGCVERGDSTIDRVVDGQRIALLELTDSDREHLESLDQPSCFAGLPGSPVVVRVDDMVHVVVPMGWLGALHSTGGSDWEWAAIGRWGIQEQDAADRPLGHAVRTPIPNLGWGWRMPRPLINAIVVAAPLLVFASIPLLRRLARRLNRDPTGVTVAIVLFGVLVLAGAALVGIGALLDGPESTITPPAVVLGAAAIGGLALAAVVLRLVGRRRPRPLPPPPPWQRPG